MPDAPPEEKPQVIINLEDAPDVFVGEPFALAGVAGTRNGQLLEARPPEVPGCVASVLCECGQPFRIDLLSEDLNACPKCSARYTHILVLAAEDDAEVFAHTLRQVLVANGLAQPEPDDDDGDGDEHAEGDQGGAGGDRGEP